MIKSLSDPELEMAKCDLHGYQRLKAKCFRKSISGYFFTLPALVVIFSLVAYPFCMAIYLSLTDAWVGSSGSFIGLQHYFDLLQNEIFIQTLKNSVTYTFFSVTLKIILGMGLALLLNQKIKFRKFFRGAILLPWVIPNTLSTLGWLWMFDPLFSVFNWVLKNIGLIEKGVPWLSNPYWAMFSVIMINVWRGLPFFAITMLAGLVSIPQELHRAARIDGAGSVKCFFHITLPLLKPLILIVVLFSTIFTISDFNIVYILTRGGPMNMTHLLSTLSFQIGLSGGKLGQGAAISLFMFPVLCVVVYFQLKTIQKGSTYD
jgi:multiple sugar transport system permease protein